MKGLVAGLVFLAVSVSGASAAEELPAWAFPVSPPGGQAQKDDGSLIRVPDSAIGMTRTEVAGREKVPDQIVPRE